MIKIRKFINILLATIIIFTSLIIPQKNNIVHAAAPKLFLDALIKRSGVVEKAGRTRKLPNTKGHDLLKDRAHLKLVEEHNIVDMTQFLKDNKTHHTESVFGGRFLKYYINPDVVSALTSTLIVMFAETFGADLQGMLPCENCEPATKYDLSNLYNLIPAGSDIWVEVEEEYIDERTGAPIQKARLYYPHYREQVFHQNYGEIVKYYKYDLELYSVRGINFEINYNPYEEEDYLILVYEWNGMAPDLEPEWEWKRYALFPSKWLGNNATLNITEQNIHSISYDFSNLMEDQVHPEMEFSHNLNAHLEHLPMPDIEHLPDLDYINIYVPVTEEGYEYINEYPEQVTLPNPSQIVEEVPIPDEIPQEDEVEEPVIDEPEEEPIPIEDDPFPDPEEPEPEEPPVEGEGTLLERIFEFLKQILQQILNAILSIPDILNNILQWLKTILLNILESILNAILSIPDILTNILNFLQNLLNQILEGILSIPTILINIWNFLNGLVQNITTAIQQLFTTLFVPAPITTTITPLITKITDKFPFLNTVPVLIETITHPSCSSLDNVNVNIMGVSGTIVDFDNLKNTSNWFKPIMRGFIWLLILFYAYRKVPAIIADRGGAQ